MLEVCPVRFVFVQRSVDVHLYHRDVFFCALIFVHTDRKLQMLQPDTES